jgi:hypothetical protein
MNEAGHVTHCQDAWRNGGGPLGWIHRNEQLLAKST